MLKSFWTRFEKMTGKLEETLEDVTEITRKFLRKSWKHISEIIIIIPGKN